MSGGGRRTKRTDRAREVFLRSLADTCNVTGSCRAASLARRTAYEWREDDADFAAAWDEAIEEAADKLEQVAFDRAKTGQSDRMLEILLKAHRPKYREKQAVEFTGSINVNHREAAKAEIEDLFGPTPTEVLPKHG